MAYFKMNYYVSLETVHWYSKKTLEVCFISLYSNKVHSSIIVVNKNEKLQNEKMQVN